MSARAGCHAPHGARRKIVRIQASWASLPPLIGRKRDRDAMAGDGGGSDDEMDIEAQAHVTDSESVHSVGSSFGGADDADEDDMDIDAGIAPGKSEPSLALGGGLGVTREIDRALGIFRAAVHGAPPGGPGGGGGHGGTDADDDPTTSRGAKAARSAFAASPAAVSPSPLFAGASAAAAVSRRASPAAPAPSAVVRARGASPSPARAVPRELDGGAAAKRGFGLADAAPTSRRAPDRPASAAEAAAEPILGLDAAAAAAAADAASATASAFTAPGPRPGPPRRPTPSGVSGGASPGVGRCAAGPRAGPEAQLLMQKAHELMADLSTLRSTALERSEMRLEEDRSRLAAAAADAAAARATASSSIVASARVAAAERAAADAVAGRVADAATASRVLSDALAAATADADARVREARRAARDEHALEHALALRRANERAAAAMAEASDASDVRASEGVQWWGWLRAALSERDAAVARAARAEDEARVLRRQLLQPVTDVESGVVTLEEMRAKPSADVGGDPAGEHGEPSSRAAAVAGDARGGGGSALAQLAQLQQLNTSVKAEATSAVNHLVRQRDQALGSARDAKTRAEMIAEQTRHEVDALRSATDGELQRARGEKQRAEAKAAALADELEDAQDLASSLVKSENAKMSRIDELTRELNYAHQAAR